MYKFKIQNFADTYDPRAVMGERMFISKTFPPTIATDQVLGVRSTPDRKSTRLNSSHSGQSRMPSSA